MCVFEYIHYIQTMHMISERYCKYVEVVTCSNGFAHATYCNSVSVVSRLLIVSRLSPAPFPPLIYSYKTDAKSVIIVILARRQRTYVRTLATNVMPCLMITMKWLLSLCWRLITEKCELFSVHCYMCSCCCVCVCVSGFCLQKLYDSTHDSQNSGFSRDSQLKSMAVSI